MLISRRFCNITPRSYHIQDPFVLCAIGIESHVVDPPAPSHWVVPQTHETAPSVGSVGSLGKVRQKNPLVQGNTVGFCEYEVMC
jgi:hypothetical protein